MIRYISFVFVIIITLSSCLFAQDIDQSWALSAGLYENKLNEIAVGYGLSNRTMLLAFTDLSFSNKSTNTDARGPYMSTSSATDEDFSFILGSEIRGYFSTGRVAPFGGLRVSSGWRKDKNVISGSDWQKNRQFLVNFGVTYGVEYFFKRSFSVYLSMNLFNYSLIRTNTEEYIHAEGITTEDTIKEHQVSISQNPAVFLRIYF